MIDCVKFRKCSSWDEGLRAMIMILVFTITMIIDDRNLDFHDCSKQVSDSPLLSFVRLHSYAESRMATDAHRFPENHDDYDLKQNEKWRTREICLTLPSGSWTSMLEAFFTQLQWRLSQRLDKYSLTKIRQAFSHKG